MEYYQHGHGGGGPRRFLNGEVSETGLSGEMSGDLGDMQRHHRDSEASDAAWHMERRESEASDAAWHVGRRESSTGGAGQILPATSSTLDPRHVF